MSLNREAAAILCVAALTVYANLRSDVDLLNFNGFTTDLVEWGKVFDSLSLSNGAIKRRPITPFNYCDNTGHTEGAFKWYVSVPHNTAPLAKIYLPVACAVDTDNLAQLPLDVRVLEGDSVYHNYGFNAYCSRTIGLMFAHVSCRKAIIDSIHRAPAGYRVLAAGTHIGYAYRENPGAFEHTFDFCVMDASKGDALVYDTTTLMDVGIGWSLRNGWARRGNPLAYFDTARQHMILSRYEPFYNQIKSEGVKVFSRLDDSRVDFSIPQTMWGLWFNDSSDHPMWGDVAWSLVRFTKKDFFVRETSWKILADSTVSGIASENAAPAPGNKLYTHLPGAIGNSRLYMVSGNDTAGIFKLREGFEDITGQTMKEAYVRYAVVGHTFRLFDDMLYAEGFATLTEAQNATTFSNNALRFRRNDPPASIVCGGIHLDSSTNFSSLQIQVKPLFPPDPMGFKPMPEVQAEDTLGSFIVYVHVGTIWDSVYPYRLVFSAQGYLPESTTVAVVKKRIVEFNDTLHKAPVVETSRFSDAKNEINGALQGTMTVYTLNGRTITVVGPRKYSQALFDSRIRQALPKGIYLVKLGRGAKVIAVN